MIGILSCVYRRPERLPYTLAQLAAQTHQDFVLVLINNNPALRDEVDRMLSHRDGSFPVLVHHNHENRGPYARLEMMVAHRTEFDWFVTLDDDVQFGPDWLASWWTQRNANAVLGWNGFRFQRNGNYWQRTQVKVGQLCHYLQGSGLMVPAQAVDEGLLTLPERYRLCCDDLWLCYYLNHVKRMPLRRVDVPMQIAVDGKDTYVQHHMAKMQLLAELRQKRGWAV